MNDYQIDLLQHEWMFLHTAAKHSDDAVEFGLRIREMVDILRRDEVGPAVMRGRFELLLCWMVNDEGFNETLYERCQQAPWTN